MNINTKAYWDKRFATGDWEKNAGTEQTRLFAETQVRFFQIPGDFSGTILDFGCGLGDAMPVYRQAYPRASLIGLDISDSATRKCTEKYGSIAEFVQGSYVTVPNVDVIIASNVFEHLSNDMEVARCLLNRCRELYIIVPFRENICLGAEHVNSYDEHYFNELGAHEFTIFQSRGWTQYGWNLWFDVYLKNLLRPFFGKKLVRRGRQIMFHFAKDPGRLLCPEM